MKKSEINAGYHAEFPLSWMRVDGGTQARVSLDHELIEEYCATMEAEHVFDPVVVWWDGKNAWVSDGHHRYWAAAKAKIRNKPMKALPALVRLGTLRDAILDSCGANGGKPRSQEDKRRAVERLLKDDDWAAWSDREVARRCRVSHTFVAGIREELAAGGNVATSNRRKGADGKTYPSPTRVVSEGAQDPSPDEPTYAYEVGEDDAGVHADCGYAPCQCGEEEDPGERPTKHAQAVAAAEARGEEITHVERTAEPEDEPDDVPDELRELFEVLAPAAAIGASLRLLVGKWRSLVEGVTAYYKAHPTDEPRLPIKELGELDVLLGAKGVKTLEHVAYRVAELAPEEVCEKCEGAGVDAEGVKCCGGRGWVSHGEAKERRRVEERAAEHAA